MLYPAHRHQRRVCIGLIAADQALDPAGLHLRFDHFQPAPETPDTLPASFEFFSEHFPLAQCFRQNSPAVAA
ncbi:MAG: hypothetical protein FGM62_07860 [Methylobacterium sp.]|nr:hypothetical protein [Methylobacterium sp.]